MSQWPATHEPIGAAQFVVLRHELPAGASRRSHWDLMLQDGPLLRTWALDDPPGIAQPVAAERLSDHRLAYLEFEGDISGGRGRVTRWDRGDLEWIQRGPDVWVADLHGERLQVRVLLTRQPETQSWLLETIPAPTAKRE